MKQTAVELLKRDLDSEMKSGTKMVVNWDMYLEVEKQQIINACKDSYVAGYIDNQCKVDDSMNFPDDYYSETYGSNHIVDTNEMINHIGDANKMVEISDDQAIEMVKDMNKQPMRFHCVPKEISDEEIEKTAKEKHIGLSRDVANYRGCFEQGAKWYREQLKQK